MKYIIDREFLFLRILPSLVFKPRNDNFSPFIVSNKIYYFRIENEKHENSQFPEEECMWFNISSTLYQIKKYW